MRLASFVRARGAPKLNAIRFTCVCATIVLLWGCSDRSARPPAKSETKTAAATCAAHGAPKDLCYRCDPSLRDPGRLWCAEHDRYEDRCWECHPELRDSKRPWCERHALYEDECFLCHPEVRRAAGPSAVPQCAEHGVREDECGICHPELLAQKRPGDGLKVRLPSPTSADKAGIEVRTSGEDRRLEGIECVAELAFDQNKLAEITPLTDGVVTAIEVDLGRHVGRGDLLARVASAAVSEAQAAYLRARADEQLRRSTLERRRALHAERIGTEQDVQEAEAAHKSSTAAVREAGQHLRVLGLTDAQLERLASEQTTPGDLEIRAPFAGEIVERAVVHGARVEAGRRLFLLADTRTLWAMVSIPESELARAKVGQSVRITVTSLPGQTFVGRLTWLAPQVDERTRMARGRVEVPNVDGQLKAQMFAQAWIVTADAGRAVIVPRSAVQSVAGDTIVFVRAAADLFDARRVQVGAQRGDQVEILAGLGSTEPVVVVGSFALKSQLLLSRLGAGCSD